MYIVSWNINGLKSRFDELKQLVNSYNPDFVCLQKVRCKPWCFGFVGRL